MRTKLSLFTKNQGFTLLEVVITLIVGSILGAILVQFMGTSMKNSFEPVIMVQERNGVNEIMEKLNSVYKMRLMTSNDPLTNFQADVLSGMNPPLAPVIGHYTVNETKYITFTGGVEDVASDTAADPNVLKVTITHGGQSLTALFTK